MNHNKSKKIKILSLGVLFTLSMMQSVVCQNLNFAKTISWQDGAVTPEFKPNSEPMEIGWKLLMDIDYKLKYFKEIEMELYAPIFSEAVKAIDGKEILIKGYVIPLDEKGEMLALSANPYSSCFFCGQASPASVISVHLKDKKKRYKMDALSEFRGVLVLNTDDPDEFYYILKDAH